MFPPRGGDVLSRGAATPVKLARPLAWRLQTPEVRLPRKEFGRRADSRPIEFDCGQPRRPVDVWPRQAGRNSRLELLQSRPGGYLAAIISCRLRIATNHNLL